MKQYFNMSSLNFKYIGMRISDLNIQAKSGIGD